MGVGAPLAAPRLALHDLVARQVVATNGGWDSSGGDSLLADTSKRVGAFALQPGSQDTALLIPLGQGIFTANVTAAGAPGIALVELYDAEPEAAAKLVNISARAHVRPGDDTLILGFVIRGTAPKRVLLRGVGPSLAQFGVQDILANPRLDLFGSDGRRIGSSDQWQLDPAMAASAAAVGAFPLDPASLDAGLLATLWPGSYTAHVTGVGGESGVALAELYVVPASEPETRWTMLNVSPGEGQADSHLIELPDGRVVMIDVADAVDGVGSMMEYLRARCIRRIDLVVLSHFHRDHYDRLRDVIAAGIEIGRVAVNMPATNATVVEAEAPWGFSREEATALLQHLEQSGIPYFTPRGGERLIEVDLGDGTWTTLDVVCLFDGANTPVGQTDTDDTSMVLRLTHLGTRVLFTGDLNGPLGTWLATSPLDLTADLLKVPHHGTEGCAPNSFFARVNPRAAFVPAPRALWLSERSRRIREYFTAQGTPAFISGIHGHVLVTLNASGFAIQSERSSTE